MNRFLCISVLFVVLIASVGCWDTDDDDNPVGPSLAGTFNLKVALSAMDPHIGDNLWFRVWDTANGQEVVRSQIASLPTTAFTLDLGRILVEGKTYNLDFFADFNENGAYDIPPIDHAWRISLADHMADQTYGFVHNVVFTNVAFPAPLASAYNLQINFTEMTPHLGDTLKMRVYNVTTKSEVARYQNSNVTAAFSVDLGKILIAGNSYYVDFFADFNDNGAYDAPPTDHAWRLSFPNVAADQIYPFVHNAVFTDIAFPY